ncbi:SigE family RNA polymerase sigma factor [Nakamurella silvestris]|nr:SigE family RNA polymerase sigma factor [Nakamurella silvestris]
MDFEQFLEAEMPGLVRFSRILTGDRQDAHDVLADALIKTGKNWEGVGAVADPPAYVRRIVVNTYLADRRKAVRRRTTPVAAVSSAVATPDFSGQIDNRDLLHQSLKQLAPQQRAVVVLRYYQDLDDAAIAAVVGTSVSTVRSNISRALTHLRVSPHLTGTERLT